MMKRTLPVVIAAAVGATMVACAVPAERRAHRVAADRVPFGLLDLDAPALLPTPAPGTASVTLCFVEGDRLAAVSQPTAGSSSPTRVVEALQAAPEFGGRSLRTAVVDATVVRAVEVRAGIAAVDLRSSISSLGGPDQLLAVAQLVCTLTGLPGVGQVSFTLEGAPVEVPRADGSLVSAPVSRDDYASLLP